MAEREKVQFEELNAILNGNTEGLNLEAALFWAISNQAKLESV
jgi:hypothetical protein